MDPEFASLAEVMPWPYMRMTREGQILYANSHWGRLFDGASLELEGQSVEAFFRSESDRDNIPEILRDLSSEAWHGNWVFSDEGYDYSFEILLQVDPKKEDCIWGIVLENPVINDHIILSVRSEQRLLQMLLDHAIDYIYFMDVRGYFVITNRAFQKAICVPYAGYEIGKRLGDFVGEETRRQFATTDRRVLDTHQPLVNHMSYFERKDGSGHWVQSTKMPVFDQKHQCIGLVCVSRDITEIKENTKKMRQAIRRAELASQAKSNFLANMSHEIRTPINGIVGMAELCLDTALNTEQQDYLESLMDCTHTLLKVVNDILDFSKIEAGQLTVEEIEFDLIRCCKDTLQHIHPTARDKGLELRFEHADDTPKYVMGDPTRLRQILYNLLNNAIKFTEDGHVNLAVKVTENHYPLPNLEICIEDTGIGIADDRQKSIFKSFTQADNSTTRKYGGTGLGLTICRQLVALMGGTLTLKSQVGEGSTFTVELPMKPNSTDPALASPQAPVVVEIGDTPALEVLLAEDNKVNRQVVLNRLVHMGHIVKTAEDGVEALDLYQQQEYDLILLDIQMPRKDGLAVARQIREWEEEKDHHTPIIAMTARALEEDREQCRQAGIDAYMAKPFKKSQLRDILTRVVPKCSDTHHQESRIQASLGKNASGFIPSLQKLDAEDREDIIAAARVYLDNYEAEIQEISQAADQGDMEQLRQLAHRTKGGVGALGDMASMEAAKVLENTAKASDHSHVSKALENLKKKMYNLAEEIYKVL